MFAHFRSGFILEDLPESQRWLARALNEAFPGIAIASAASLVEGRSLITGGLRPGIALIDLGLPDGSGISLIEEIKRDLPATLCVVASIYDDDGHIFPALRAGAGGYLLKDQPALAALDENHDGVVDDASAEKFCRAVPQGRFLRVPDCGHVPQEEKPEAVRAAIAEFLGQEAPRT